MTNKAKSYCTCHSEEELKAKPWLAVNFTTYKEMPSSDGETCDRCGHFVVWVKDHNGSAHRNYVRKANRNESRRNNRYDHEYTEPYAVKFTAQWNNNNMKLN